MQTKAKAQFIRLAPRKVRLVAELIKGMDVEKAEQQLQFSPKHSSLVLLKLLKSAVSNAEENLHLRRNNLFVKAITVNEGPTLHRWMPRAMGRATPIRKRTAHILLTLEERVETKPADIKKKTTATDDMVTISGDKAIKDHDEVKGAIDIDELPGDEKAKAKVKPAGKGFGQKMFNRRSGSK